MSIVGWYYLHTNGEVIYKPDPSAAMDIRDSDFARGLWPMDPSDRAGAWAILVEASAAGANPQRIQELAAKWGCNDGDAEIYALYVGAKLFKDGAAWCATRADFQDLATSPAGFGDTALQAFADLAKTLGYRPSTMWGTSFAELVQRVAA